jgi:hypothetical protein
MTIIPLDLNFFNDKAILLHGITTLVIKQSMTDCLNYLQATNDFHEAHDWPTVDVVQDSTHFSTYIHNTLLTFMSIWCVKMFRNTYNNGYPDLLPMGMYENNSVKHGDGCEIKCTSTGLNASLGHSAKNGYFVIFGFDKSPFRFTEVYANELVMGDWNYSGRKEGSSRTPTSYLNQAGKDKMRQNCIYAVPRDPSFGKRKKKKGKDSIILFLPLLNKCSSPEIVC